MRLQQARVIGYAMQAAHDLSSPDYITHDELYRIIMTNIKENRLGRVEQYIVLQVFISIIF
jgi:hypothetical protein